MDWGDQINDRFRAEREIQLNLLSDAVSAEARKEIMKNIEEMTQMHNIALAQVGSAHRAASDLPPFELINAMKKDKDFALARERAKCALKIEKMCGELNTKLKIQNRQQKDNAIVEANRKSKQFIERRKQRKPLTILGNTLRPLDQMK